MCFSDIYWKYKQDIDPKRFYSHPFLKSEMAFNKKAKTTRDGMVPRINPLFSLGKDYYNSKEFLRDAMINISSQSRDLAGKT